MVGMVINVELFHVFQYLPVTGLLTDNVFYSNWSMLVLSWYSQHLFHAAGKLYEISFRHDGSVLLLEICTGTLFPKKHQLVIIVMHRNNLLTSYILPYRYTKEMLQSSLPLGQVFIQVPQTYSKRVLRLSHMNSDGQH